jgi:uncharacterized protein (DUF1697 family)
MLDKHNPADPTAVLLRGVNVSGRNRLPMQTFPDLLNGLGLTAVETFIQSGNAVFCGGPDHVTLAPLIRDALQASVGFAPEVFLLRLPELEAALNHPFGPDARPNQVHAHFLRPDAVLDDARLLALRRDEAWQMVPGLFLLHTPSGLGTSKLAEALPRALKGPMTARNLNTVAALAAMLRSRIREQGTG